MLIMKAVEEERGPAFLILDKAKFTFSFERKIISKKVPKVRRKR